MHSRPGACLGAQQLVTTRPVPQKEVPLGNPDVLVCSVGTEIFFEATGASPEANQQWKTELDQGWDRQAAIDAAGKLHDLKPQVWRVVALVFALHVQESTSRFTLTDFLQLGGPAWNAGTPAVEHRLRISFARHHIRVMLSRLPQQPPLPLCRIQVSSARTS